MSEEEQKNGDVPLSQKKEEGPSRSIGAKPAFKKEKENFIRREERTVQDFLLDHEPLKIACNWVFWILGTLVSAFAFAYGFRSMIAPTYQIDGAAVPHLISGGVSGMSQVILRIAELCGFPQTADAENTFTSVSYALINFPLFLIALRFIGKRFAFITLLNVVFSSILIRVIPESWVQIFQSMSHDYIARAIFSGLLTGISSGTAYAIGSSTGGVDIVTYVIAEKHGTTIGKYYIIVNAVTVTLYTIFNALKLAQNGQEAFGEVAMSLYSLIYFFMASKTLDLINTKNKKIELQINTDNENMAMLLLRTFPHGCTIIDAVGGYTGKPRKVIYMVVSSNEVKKVVSLARKIDPHCFVNVTNSVHVYGKFYTKPMD